MTQYTYSTTNINCTTDTYSNICAYPCCYIYSGGLLDPITTCTSSIWCIGTPTTTVAKSVFCDIDVSGNICYDKCCSQIAMSNGTLNNYCQPKLFCQGINSGRLTPTNIGKLI